MSIKSDRFRILWGSPGIRKSFESWLDMKVGVDEATRDFLLELTWRKKEADLVFRTIEWCVLHRFLSSINLEVGTWWFCS